MIVYRSTKSEFADHVATGDIGQIILGHVREASGHKVAKSEIQSWQNSLGYMSAVLSDDAIPSDAGVSVEYHIPRSSKRIDFLVSGKDEHGKENVLLIELKQWSTAERTDMDGIVRTRLKRGQVELSHPSYQAWSYASLITSFNETVEVDDIGIRPCAYCHNYDPDDVLTHSFYSEYLAKAPLFLKPDDEKLRDFIKSYVKVGDKGDVFVRIDGSRIRPSKSLSDAVLSMLKGKPEFVMIDDQKVVYETAMALAAQAGPGNRHVLIVEGGPGTGKSVVAVNLLAALTGKGMRAQYVTKNAAPRAVYEQRLTGAYKKTAISNLFTGSGTFYKSGISDFDVLIVDEAHRLNEKSGLYKTFGENQIMEIIRASNLSIFFLDEDQRVTFDDIGHKKEIRRWAESQGATVHRLTLASQFRCNGSDAYLAWLDNTLQIRETANEVLEPGEFDFRVVDSPSEMERLIMERNQNNRARMVAGYCWDWKSKKDANVDDIVFSEDGFAHRWNLTEDGSLWIEKPDSVHEVGCIHTCQGLELDYVGVIVGPDLQVQDGDILTDASRRARNDSSVRGYKKMLKQDPAQAKVMADRVIKNTYKTLFTRGMKGCFVYFVDKEVEHFFRSRIAPSPGTGPEPAAPSHEGARA